MSRRLLPKPSFTATSADENRVTKPLDRRVKRNCVATACMPCRKRRSKCDGQTPCAACLSNDKSECFYDKESDGRRSGTLKKHVTELSSDNNNLRCILGTLQNSSEDYMRNIVNRLRMKEDIEVIAKYIKEHPPGSEPPPSKLGSAESDRSSPLVPREHRESTGSTDEGWTYNNNGRGTTPSSFGGSTTSVGSPPSLGSPPPPDINTTVRSWTTVTDDVDFIRHILDCFFIWQHACTPIFSRRRFLEDFIRGRSDFCSSILVNALLALGCAFSDRPGTRTHPEDSTTAGDHFYAEVERLLEIENVQNKITTIQALGILSMRESGYLRDVKGWFYGSLALRAASETLHKSSQDYTEPDLEVWRVTYWGLFNLDLSWSIAIARLPQLTGRVWELPTIDYESDKEEYLEPAELLWYSTGKVPHVHGAFLQYIKLSGIAKDIVNAFYSPSTQEEKVTPKMLDRFHRRLLAWDMELPEELRLSSTTLPHILQLHLICRATTIMLFRPFLQVPVCELSKNSPRSICKKVAKEIIKIAHRYRHEIGHKYFILPFCHYTFLACQTFLQDQPAEEENLNHGLRLLAGAKDLWPAGALGLFGLPRIAETCGIQLSKETLSIPNLTKLEVGRMASTSWASAREEEVKVVTDEFLDYWERAFADV
ncbi:fungal-specific transcription factor domain-containing protein [Morchella snyderi]|nr:fungal-specific transcription factor domain-containing protein [Morchella snyderi]